jgi:hypothetical protein
MSSISDFLNNVQHRDLVAAFVQWVPMTLGGALGMAGQRDLAASLLKLSQLADGYRAVTRFGGLFDTVSAKRLGRITAAPNMGEQVLAALDFGNDVGFFISEHLAVLERFGVIKSKVQFASMAVFFWFWGLTVKVIAVAHELLSAATAPGADDSTAKKSQQRVRKLRASLLKLLCYWVFSMTCVSGKMMPFPKGSPLAALTVIFSTFTPPQVTLPLPVRGALGLTATLCEFA